MTGFVIRSMFLFSVAGIALYSNSQTTPLPNEQQIEQLAEHNDDEIESEELFQQLEKYQHDPIHLNTAEKTELSELGLLTDIQIEMLHIYIRSFGKLMSVYELQAVPGWDILTIRKILPFITVDDREPVKQDFNKRFSKGTHTIIVRASTKIGKQDLSTAYLGTRLRLYTRYTYAYKNTLQYGLVGDKDEGEAFGKYGQKAGFDFYSFHLFAKNAGPFAAVAIGDFTVNQGQGLIHWQSLAFKKSAEVTAIKRQSPVLRPYHSAGEFYFFRGAAFALNRKNSQASLFISYRNLSANTNKDSAGNIIAITSMLTSGYHRTQNEIDKKNILPLLSFGGNLKWKKQAFQLGLNGIYHTLKVPINKRTEPYNLYALNGRQFYNLSIDYTYTWKNIHFFGETASDSHLTIASVNGLIAAIDPRIDIAVLQRMIPENYQSLYGNSFTENTLPVNELGWYWGVTYRLSDALRISGYSDRYHFPWLKATADAPSSGKDFLVQLQYVPSRNLELYIRYRFEQKEINGESLTGLKTLGLVQKNNLRLHLNFQTNKGVTLRQRVELMYYNNGNSISRGFLSFMDLLLKPQLKKYDLTGRFLIHSSHNYESRIYAYENDVLYGSSIPAFSGKGTRIYIIYKTELRKHLTVWIKGSASFSMNEGPPLPHIPQKVPPAKGEIRIQLRYIFN